MRNALLGEPVADIDIATTTLPDETVRRAEAAGFKAVPTGIEHGTITVIAGGRPYEVTTLRADVETDGRRAKVRLRPRLEGRRRAARLHHQRALCRGRRRRSSIWSAGSPTSKARTLRFIGDAEARIREDYLRILRFFRFFAWYGAGRPDAEGLKACARLKDGLDRLSAERVWAELKKLLSAPDPSRALLWMRQAGVLTEVLPESEKWGIDAIHGLVAAERDLGWAADPLLRLEAIVPPDAERMASAGRAAEAVEGRGRAADSLGAGAAIAACRRSEATGEALYRGEPAGDASTGLRLALASARGRAPEDDGALMRGGRLFAAAEIRRELESADFPLKGGDLRRSACRTGPELGQAAAAAGGRMGRSPASCSTATRSSSAPRTIARRR